MEKVINFAKRNVHILIITALAVLGLIFGSIFDYQISQRLYDPAYPGDAFTILVAGFAEFPTYLLCTFGGAGLIATMPTDKTWKKVLSWVVGLLSIIIATGAGIKTTTEYIVQAEAVKDYTTLLKVLGLLIVLGCSVLVILVVFLKKDKFDKKKLFKTSIFMIAVAGSYVIISNVVKYGVCRPRPLIVFDPESGVAFRNWFVINPFDAFKHGADKDLYLSFPSGHTGAAFTLVGTLPALFALFESTNTKKMEIVGIYTGLVFGLACALGRILSGAHFLADVSMGALLVCIEILVIKELLPVIFRKCGVKDE